MPFFLIFCNMSWGASFAICVSIAFMTLICLACRSYHKIKRDIDKGAIHIAKKMGGMKLVNLIYLHECDEEILKNDHRLSEYQKANLKKIPLEAIIRANNVVEEIAIAAAMKKPKVFINLASRRINSCAIGHSPRDAVILISYGAATLLSRDELQGLVAHEISHILNGDMINNLNTVIYIQVLYSFNQMIADIMEKLKKHDDELDNYEDEEKEKIFSMDYFSNKENKKIGNILIYFVLFVMYTISFGAILIVGLIKHFISLNAEYLADASAIKFTRNPAAVKKALLKAKAELDYCCNLSAGYGSGSNPFACVCFVNGDVDFSSATEIVAKRVDRVADILGSKVERNAYYDEDIDEDAFKKDLDHLYRADVSLDDIDFGNFDPINPHKAGTSSEDSLALGMLYAQERIKKIPEYNECFFSLICQFIQNKETLVKLFSSLGTINGIKYDSQEFRKLKKKKNGISLKNSLNYNNTEFDFNKFTNIVDIYELIQSFVRLSCVVPPVVTTSGKDLLKAILSLEPKNVFIACMHGGLLSGRGKLPPPSIGEVSRFYRYIASGSNLDEAQKASDISQAINTYASAFVSNSDSRAVKSVVINYQVVNILWNFSRYSKEVQKNLIDGLSCFGVKDLVIASVISLFNIYSKVYDRNEIDNILEISATDKKARINDILRSCFSDSKGSKHDEDVDIAIKATEATVLTSMLGGMEPPQPKTEGESLASEKASNASKPQKETPHEANTDSNYR